MPVPSTQWSSKQLAIYVVLVLMSMVLSFIEVSFFLGAPWLLYDASGAVAALAALMYGPWMGVAVAALSWIPHLVGDPLGAFMNIMASASMALVLGSVARKGCPKPLFAGGVLASVALATAVSICLNFVVTPLYFSMTYQDVVALVAPYLLPFNLLKAALNVAAALAAHRWIVAQFDPQA